MLRYVPMSHLYLKISAAGSKLQTLYKRLLTSPDSCKVWQNVDYIYYVIWYGKNTLPLPAGPITKQPKPVAMF